MEDDPYPYEPLRVISWKAWATLKASHNSLCSEIDELVDNLEDVNEKCKSMQKQIDRLTSVVASYQAIINECDACSSSAVSFCRPPAWGGKPVVSLPVPGVADH
jgi:hypothetical protein